MGGIVFLRHTAPSVPKHGGFYNEYLSIFLCRARRPVFFRGWNRLHLVQWLSVREGEYERHFIQP